MLKFLFELGSNTPEKSWLELATPFFGMVTALISVAGVILAAAIAYRGAVKRIEFERSEARKKVLRERAETERQSRVIGTTMEREIFHRLYDMAWIRDAVKKTYKEHQAELPEYLMDDVFDTPTIASITRIGEFAKAAWGRLEKVHAKQQHDLSYYISWFETGCENMNALVERAHACRNLIEKETEAEAINRRREKFEKNFNDLLSGLNSCVDAAVADYKKKYPGTSFGL